MQRIHLLNEEGEILEELREWARTAYKARVDNFGVYNYDRERYACIVNVSKGREIFKRVEFFLPKLLVPCKPPCTVKNLAAAITKSLKIGIMEALDTEHRRRSTEGYGYRSGPVSKYN